MDKSAMMEAMKTSISEVLEQMFYMPIDFIAPGADSPDPETGNASIIAKLGFSGSPSSRYPRLWRNRCRPTFWASRRRAFPTIR